MVTRTQINRLSSRIEGLAEQLGLAVVPRYKVWLFFDGESDEEFYARHRGRLHKGITHRQADAGRAAGDECNFLPSTFGSAVSRASVRASSARSRNCVGSWVGAIIPTDVLARAADYVFVANPNLCAVSKEFIALGNQ